MDNSPLRLLPLELRLDIYERVLHAEQGVKVTLNQPARYQRKRLSRHAYARQPHALAIQSTCKQIAHETVGLVFDVNDSWSFVHMDDNSAAWGTRVRKWCQSAGEECLNRARDVQFDIGTWDSRADRRPRGYISDMLYSEICSMYQNLPKQLRQCEQSFKLRIRWKGDIALVDGVAHNVSPLTLVLRMWKSRAEITASLRGSISRSEDKLQQYDHLSRLLSMAGLWPQLSRSPDKLLDNRVMPEIFPLSMLVSDVESSSRCIFWNDSLRKRLDGIALDG